MIKFILLSLLFVFSVGCRQRSRDRIEVLQNTRIESASLVGPNLSSHEKVLDFEKLRLLFSTMRPNHEVEGAFTQSSRYSIRVRASGNIADIEAFISGDEIVFRLDGTEYRGGNASKFLDAYKSLVESGLAN